MQPLWWETKIKTDVRSKDIHTFCSKSSEIVCTFAVKSGEALAWQTILPVKLVRYTVESVFLWGTIFLGYYMSGQARISMSTNLISKINTV